MKPYMQMKHSDPIFFCFIFWFKSVPLQVKNTRKYNRKVEIVFIQRCTKIIFTFPLKKQLILLFSFHFSFNLFLTQDAAKHAVFHLKVLKISFHIFYAEKWPFFSIEY